MRLKKKLHFFEACIVSELPYSTHTCWLDGAKMRRLDAFQAKCLRQIQQFPHSYIGRISNEDVRRRADAAVVFCFFFFSGPICKQLEPSQCK